MVEVVVASRNEAKIKEIKEILTGINNIRILSLKDYPEIPPIIEDGKSFKENAIKKAKGVAQYTGKIALADDSGLEVDALGGKPGIFSSSIAKDDFSRNQKILSLLKDTPPEKRGACFRCVIAIANPNGKIIKIARGSCKGIIASKMRGKEGFGYDPIFIIPRFNKTFAELGPKIKNRISHRARALKRIKEVLLSLDLEGSHY